MKSLLIVDLQNDFLPGGSLAVAGGDQIIPMINHLQSEFDLIVASKDWHPQNHISFASHHRLPVGSVVEGQILWPDHCVQGSRGAEFPDSLDSSKIAHIAYKGQDPNVDSYSAFFDQKEGSRTTLYDFLIEKGVDHLFVVGLATEYCVRASVLDALTLGFKVTVLTEVCRGIDPKDSQQAIEEMRSAGARII